MPRGKKTNSTLHVCYTSVYQFTICAILFNPHNNQKIHHHYISLVSVKLKKRKTKFRGEKKKIPK